MKSEIRHHWQRVRDLGCILTSTPDPTLHHCKGGSMRPFVQKGMGQKTSDWLVIPIAWPYHTGVFGIDSGQPSLTVDVWEELFGSQVELLDEVSRRIGVNVWEKAGINRYLDDMAH